MVINMGTTLVEEAATNIMVITIMVDSEETMEATREMDMLATIITVDSTVQILNPRKISAKCFATSATTRAIMPMNAQKRKELKQLPNPILLIKDM